VAVPVTVKLLAERPVWAVVKVTVYGLLKMAPAGEFEVMLTCPAAGKAKNARQNKAAAKSSGFFICEKGIVNLKKSLAALQNFFADALLVSA
jgi:hypothetical protein